MREPVAFYVAFVLFAYVAGFLSACRLSPSRTLDRLAPIAASAGVLLLAFALGSV